MLLPASFGEEFERVALSRATEHLLEWGRKHLEVRRKEEQQAPKNIRAN